jgi:ABC-type transport system involved in multi-copper enzyme maturation permease subunit
MKGQMAALKAELIKLRHAPIVWITFMSFALAPVMGGVFMSMVQNPDPLAKTGGLYAKAQAMNLAADWASYLVVLTQAVGVGGVLVFGFAASWIFGREYAEGTAKDLLALPTSRTEILNAKFIVYLWWCFALSLANLLLAMLIGTILDLPPLPIPGAGALVTNYFLTTLLTIMLGTPIAFLALWGKGFLAPLGFVALTLVFAQVMAATGYGYYFPWSVPGLFSGAGGEYKAQLNALSYAFLSGTSLAGYCAAVLYWQYSDQTG